MSLLNGVRYNVLDNYTKETNNSFKVTTWHDGSAMTDSKVDGVIFLKDTATGEYYKDVTFDVSKEVNIKKYGLPGDGIFHSISSVLPNVTLSQVQAIDAGASLSSSADWYIISMLLKILPIQSTIILQGSFVIDRTIIIKRGFIEIKGINSNKTDIYLNHKAKLIQQGNGKDVFKVIDGDGTTYAYGVGQVQHVYFENFIIEGTMSAANQSGNGFSLNTSPQGTTGTAIGFYFKNIAVRSCLNGFMHVTGHVNDFFFDQCEFMQNFNAGFISNGNPQNQINYFTFKDCGFNSNGYQVVSGAITDYVQNTSSPDLTKGGFISSQIVAFTFTGASAQSNKGYGFYLGTGAHLGVILNGYSEANTLGDLGVTGNEEFNRNVIAPGFYSANQTYVFENNAVKNLALFLPGSQVFNSINATDVSNTNPGKVAIGHHIDYAPLAKLDVRDDGAISDIRAGFLTSALGVRLRWNNDAGRAEIVVDGNYSMDIRPGTDRAASFRPNGGVVIGRLATALYSSVDDDSVLVEGNVKAASVSLKDLNTAPASATATGTTGEIRITTGFIYVCVAANTWVRSALTTW